MQHGSPHWPGLVTLIQIVELCQVKIAIPVPEGIFLFCPTGSSGHLKIENKEDLKFMFSKKITKIDEILPTIQGPRTQINAFQTDISS